MELFINKISHYLPDSVVPNSYFKEVNGLDDEWIYSRTGIKNRSKAAANENTNTMGIKAVDLATTDLPYPMEEIDLIIAATYSPYDTVATPAHMVQRRYHIEHAKCVSVSSACSSFINAMEIVSAMPEYTKAQSELQALNKQLGQDLQRSQEEFSKKYQEFMQQKDSLPAVIAERRQKELEDMMQRQEQFQAKAQQDMEKANNDLMAPVYKKLDDAIKAVGAAEGVIYIFDMARTPIPYVNEAQSINLTPKVKTQLGIK